MPIVFVHGVNVRSTDDFSGIETHLRTTVAPLLVQGTPRSAASVHISSCYWGDLASSFAWNLASLPANSSGGVAAMGPVGPDLARKLLPLAGSLSNLELGDLLARQTAPNRALDATTIAMGPWQAPTTFYGAEPDYVSSLLISALAAQDPAVDAGDGRIASLPRAVAEASIALDTAAREIVPTVGADEAAEVTLNRISDRAAQLATAPAEGVVAMGPGIVQTIIGRTTDVVKALVDHANDATGEALAQALVRIRTPISAFISRFVGDVIVYVNSRDANDGSPGPIVARVAAALQAARDAERDEPLIVLTHSMGGQILYDLATWYLAASDLTIDFWGAAACQVGLFEEMKLFKASKPEYKVGGHVPALPAQRVRAWVGYWDPSDVLSFLTSPIVDGVRDRVFTSGTTPFQAHGQYLIQPRFYRMLADDVAGVLARIPARSATAGAPV